MSGLTNCTNLYRIQYTSCILFLHSNPSCKVIELAYTDFLDLKNLTEQTCLNFNKNTLGANFKLSDVSVLKVEKENLDRFFYKTSLKGTDYKEVNVINERRTRTPLLRSLLGIQLKQAYTKAIPITKKKNTTILCFYYERITALFNYFSTILPRMQ